MRILLLSIGCFIFSTLQVPIYAQNRVSGQVQEENGTPLAGAIVIQASTENAYMGQTMSDSLGVYTFAAPANRDFSLIISAPGYSDTTLVVRYLPEDRVLEPVRLRVKTNIMLDKVVVTAQPFSLTQTSEGLSFKLINQALIANNSVFSSLRLAPLLRVDELTGISMLGKDRIEFFINGHRSRMSAEAFNNYLRGLPASDIENIEILMNPGSAYNTGANTGIVNITLKSRASEGLKGNLSTQLFYSRLLKESVLGNFNYNRKKFSLNSSFTLRNSGDYRRLDTETHYLEENHYSRARGRNDGRRQIYTFNVDAVYRLNSNQTLGVVLDYYAYPGRPTQEMNTRYGQWPGTVIDSIVQSRIVRDNIDWRISGNVNFVQKIGKNDQIKFDVDYLHGQYSNKADYVMNIVDENDLVERGLENYKQDNPQTSDVWIFEAGFTHRFDNNGNINFGIEGHHTAIDYRDTYAGRNTLAGTPWEDNLYRYADEGIAGYISSSIGGKKITSTLGARLLYNRLKGEQSAGTENFSKDYLYLNPSLSIVFRFSDKTNVSYSASLRTRYPSFSFFNPFTIYYSATSYSKGNPSLSPSLVLGQYLTLTLPKGFLVQLTHSTTYDAVETFDRVWDGSNITERMPVNFGRNSTSALTLGYSGQVVRNAWNVNVSFSEYYMSFKNRLDWISFDRNHSDYVWFKWGNVFTLSARHRWQLTAEFNYFSAYKWVNYATNPQIMGSMVLSKKIGNWDMSLYAYTTWRQFDGRYSMDGKRTTSTSEIYSIQYSKTEPQGIQVSVGYAFGNQRLRVSRSRDNSGEHKQRIQVNDSY